MTAVASLPASPWPKVDLLGVPIDRLTERELLDYIVAESRQGRGGWVLTPNLEVLRQLVTNPQYAADTADATIRIADGMPLVWASRLQRTPLPERIAGSELVWSLTARAAVEGLSVFFLGGNPGVADAAAERLKAMHPSLRVAGTECPPFGFEKDEGYLAAIQHRLQQAKPDICYVALTSAKQDRLIRMLRPHLPGTWFLGIGISFSFVVGEVRQAPVWARRLGVEWLCRLVQEPRRLARRYLIDGVPFAVRLLASSAAKGLAGRSAVRETGVSSAPPVAPDKPA